MPTALTPLKMLTTSIPVLRPWRFLLALVLTLPILGCASTAPAPDAAPAEPASADEAMEAEEMASASEAASDTAPDAASEEPADRPSRMLASSMGSKKAEDEAAEAEPAEEEREWLVDEQGRSYYIETMNKDHIKVWRHLGGNQVRIPWGQTIEVVNEDDDYFYYKRYNVEHIRTRRYNTPPTEEELAAVAERYVVEVRDSDRIRLEAAQQGLPERGQWRNGFVLADMNEDGHLDIVHGPPRKQTGPPVIFLGDSKGSWKLWSEAQFPRLGLDYGDVAVADFNQDGHPDLAVTSHLRGATVLVGDGQGAFTAWSEGIAFVRRGGEPNIFTSRTMDVLDWNGDGWMDLLLFGEGPRLAVSRSGEAADFSPSSSYGAVIYLNQGDGSWKRLRKPTQLGDVFGDSLSVADFNGDGRMDFVTGSSVMGNKTILNLAQEDGSWREVEVPELRDRAYIRAVRAADLNGDSRTDLAVAYMSFELVKWRSGIDLLLARPDGTWDRQTVIVEESRDGIYALDIGDLDGDGHQDLVALTGVGALWTLLGDGDGGFTRELSPEAPPEAGGCRGYHVALVDFDGDGRDEVIAGFAGEATIIQMDECPSGGALRAWDVAGAAR